MVNLGERPGGPASLILGIKKSQKEEKPAGQAKQNHPFPSPHLSSRSGSATEYKLESKTCHYSANAATSFPGSLILTPPLEGSPAPGGGKMRDPGNEVANVACTTPC